MNFSATERRVLLFRFIIVVGQSHDSTSLFVRRVPTTKGNPRGLWTTLGRRREKCATRTHFVLPHSRDRNGGARAPRMSQHLQIPPVGCHENDESKRRRCFLPRGSTNKRKTKWRQRLFHGGDYGCSWLMQLSWTVGRRYPVGADHEAAAAPRCRQSKNHRHHHRSPHRNGQSGRRNGRPITKTTTTITIGRNNRPLFWKTISSRRNAIRGRTV
jgi:hypothetical protein